MKSFEYADNEIGKNEVTMSIANMVIGFGVLTLPRTIINETHSIDGWISIALGGITAICFTWILAKLAARFPKKISTN